MLQELLLLSSLDLFLNDLSEWYVRDHYHPYHCSVLEQALDHKHWIHVYLLQLQRQTHRFDSDFIHRMQLI